MVVGPAPGGASLRVGVECRSSRTAQGGSRHEVVIGPDWSVSTPHDLDAERVATAFGGYTSCLDLVESAVPAMRASMGLLTRRVPPELKCGPRGAWRPQRAKSCCNRWFDDARWVVRHQTSASHIALQHGALEWQVAALLREASRAWGSWEVAPVSERAQRVVREVNGVDFLWQAGLHPDLIVDLAAQVPGLDEPMPTSYFLALAYRPVDREWLGATVAHRPDPDVAAWLAWLDRPQDLGQPHEWGGWLRLGVPRRQLIALLRARTPVSDAFAMAELLGVDAHTAALYVARWAEADCRLGAEHVNALRQHDVRFPQPSKSAIDVLCADTITVDRADLAVMLEILGNRVEVKRALGAGVRTLSDLTHWVDAGVA